MLDAIILGVVEGITEFLPISSTGHLILVAGLLGLPSSEFLTTFQIAIQLGAMFAIITLYWRRIWFDRSLDRKVLVALLPALIVGAFFYGDIRSLFESTTTVVWALGIGGIILILFELWRKRSGERGVGLDQLSYGTAMGIGIFQVLSVIPGVSRAGATILGGLVLGLDRRAIVEFSFLLALPTMFAATTLDIWKHGASFSLGEFELLAVGSLVSFGVALLAVKFLLHFVVSHSFISFGVYRVCLALLFLLFIL